jgi:co-chaperonin GroES (HSP10)
MDINQSGQRPIEYKIIVKMPSLEEKTSGGIIIPSQLKDKLEFGQGKGILVAVGGKAFSDFPESDMPKVGDMVSFRSYSGLKIDKDESKDGSEYRIMLDKELTSIHE